ncbi:CLUMA_CG016910, isoform A [Clunio marinus]|uniref:CLUMA_CG016910, isoform A n=1 Tax=Clunio marinus TaxID=568069 RepID=A0A1J1IRY7_9DIPT|nr:CLUMA_CG016910, isoform A [Clunio marinus]
MNHTKGIHRLPKLLSEFYLLLFSLLTEIVMNLIDLSREYDTSQCQITEGKILQEIQDNCKTLEVLRLCN